ncbi:YDG domain-containing protein [Janthinobacterium tructae]|uniref:Filamentous hemagglutinin N-terminal domain-containing protein n=1 Tax=Janthinobacterium tructae TaxID=2590869 RepID=A0A4Y6RMY3_9BURK|nr:YDG domain-containing protein [Janthinobacterium tructae]QDG74371.1 filamentous hemagglutinin N-terminal domain-containing protein [Janthinobacterium tructae]
MNRIYRSIWNQATGAYAAVSENVKSAGKRSMPGCSGGGAHFALTSMAAALMLGYGSLALAGPAGGTVVAGQATINGAPGATVIKQGSQNAVINWASFNVGKGESVQFQQPNSNAVALNRVLGSDGTIILGNLSANGKVFIVNPNGVLFGQGASVNTAGLVASTLDINNADFMAGKYQFSGNGTGKVLNQGSISAPGGYVALLGANVSNEGTIQARLGSVALAAGRAITLDVAGDGLLNVAVNAGAVGALVNNGGMIRADGGSVVLTAQAAGDLLKTVVNNTGVIEAQTIDTRGGTIKLLGDMQSGTVNAGGTLDASAPLTGNGGFVDTSAAHVKIDDALKVTTASAKGMSGTWLIDPTDFNIAVSGGDMTGTFLSNSLKSGNVQIQSVSGAGGTQGNINVNDNVNWSANKLTLTAQNNININKAMRGSGTASLALEYGQSGVAAGNLATYNVKAEVDLPSGNNFSTKLGSDGGVTVYQVINSLGAFNSTTGNDVQGLEGNLSGNYVLGSNIDARATGSWESGKGFMPIGNDTTPFTGTLDGLGHEIIGLTINRPEMAIGMFGNIGTGGAVRNMGLGNVSVAGSVAAYASSSYAGIGALAAVNNGKIDNVYSSGAVHGSGYINMGALVGTNAGTISNSRAAGTVVAGGFGAAGGLVGENAAGGFIKNSSSAVAATSTNYFAGGLAVYNRGTISDSYATGAVSVGGTGGSYGGGLAAINTGEGTVTNSYATGNVTGASGLGGLLGRIESGAVTNSYATGNVTGTNNLGGLVGVSAGPISNSYATGNVTGNSTVGGVVGYNIGVALTNAYYSGKLTTTGINNGAIVGDHNGGSIVNAYFNSTLNPAATAVGHVGNGATTVAQGLTSAQMLQGSNFAGFNFTTTAGAAGNNWVIVSGDGSLNGASAGTRPMLASEWSNTINSTHQLQLMAMSKAASYTLGSSFSAASTAANGNDVWGSTGFIPVGTAGSAFTGSLDGTGHIVSNLNIIKSGVAGVGLFGVVGSGGVIANVGLSGGTISGGDNTGALVGTNGGSVSGSFATSAVTGANNVGGLVGSNTGTGTIKDSYASGAVTGSSGAGGLVGSNSGTLDTSYANGSVSGAGGGLVGTGAGSVTGSYWDSTASGKATSAGGTELTTSGLKTLSNYTGAGWELGQMWVAYDGQSAPFLRSFMKQIAVRVSYDSKVYDGVAYAGGSNSVTYSNTVAGADLLGTLAYAGNATGAVNAGTYGVSASGLYATGGQSGYAISYIDGGLVITPKALTVTGATAADKTYDGSATAAITGGALNGLVGGETLVLNSVSGVFNSQNAGNGKAVTVTGASLGNGSGLASNYTVGSSSAGTANITPKALTVTGATAADKTYDGNATAAITGGALHGLVSGETLVLNSASGVFNNQNAGNGKAVTVTGASLGNDSGLASNYTVAQSSAGTANITPKALTVTGATAADKTYDGNATAALTGGALNGLVGGETLVLNSASGVFNNQNAGNAKAVTLTGASLGDGTGLASNYTVAQSSAGTANITPKALTVTGATAADKTYDGSATAAITGGALDGLVSGETLVLNSASGVFNNQNAGNGKAVTVTGASLGDDSGLASNYTVAQSSAGTANITPKALTVTGATAADKTYDGNATAALTGGALNGLVGGETLVLNSASGVFNNQNAGNGKAVTVTGASLGNGSGLASNYTVAQSSAGTANITPKALTVTGATAADKTYDGSATAAITGGALDGLVSGETLVLNSASGVFNNQNAGNGKAVTLTGASLGDGTGLASNYTVAQSSAGTANITPKALTVTGATAADKTYDGNATAAITGGALHGLVGGETLVLNSASGVFNNQNAGNAKAVTVTGASLGDGTGLASNYTVAQSSAGTANITPKALTVTGATAADKTYDGNATAALTGGALDGLVSGETLVLNSASGVFNNQNAGNGKAVTVTGASLGDGTGLASNYTVAQSSAGTANITPKALTVTDVTASSRVYDGTQQASLSGGVLSGLVGLETLNLDLSNQAGTFSDKNVGAGKVVTVTGATVADGTGLASNYAFSNATGVTANISKATISSVSNVGVNNKTYDGSMTATLSGTAIFNGKAGADNLTVSSGNGSFVDKNAGAGKTVNVSNITLGGADAGNYLLDSTTSSGVADIAKATISSVSNVGVDNKTYDGLRTATLKGTASFDGIIGNDSLSVAGSGLFSDKNAGTAKVVTVSGITLAGADAGNYILGSNASSGTADITPKALTVAGQVAGNKVYDGNAVAQLSGGSLVGLVGGETLGFSGQTAAFSDKNAASAKTVTVSGTTLLDGSGAASNYTVVNPTGLTASITPKALTVAGQVAGNKVYDGNAVAQLLGGSLVGLVGDETLVIAGQTAAFSDKNAASAKTVTVSGTTLLDGSGAASNYTVVNPTGLTASITPKALTVAGQFAGNKVYDGNAVAQLLGGSLVGLVGDETLVIAGQTAAFSDKNAANAKTVTVSGTTLLDGSGAASNYTVVNPTGLTASITPKALTVAGQVAGNKVYDGNAVAQLSGGSLVGLVGDETLVIAGQTAAFSDKNAASAKTVTVSGTTLLDGSGAASNYTVVNPTGLTASITPKALTVAGQVAGNKVYDGNAVAQLLGGSLVGLVGDETLVIAGQTAAFSDKNAASAKTVTVSGTTLLDGSGSASNYSVSNPTGLTASITPKALTVAGQIAGNKVYDGNTVAQLIGGSLVGLVGDETLAIAGQTAAFSDKNAASAKTVTVSGTTLLDGSGAASNYTVVNPTGLTASITPASISAISGIVAANKVYDGGTAASLNLAGASFNGMLAGDALSLGSGPVLGTFSDKNAALGKTVVISGLGLAGADAGNYVLASSLASTTATITPAALTVSAIGVNKVYDASTTAAVSLRDNRIGNDQLSIASNGASFSDKNAGVGKTVTVAGISLSGTDAGNYVVNSSASTTATISQAALTVKVDNTEKDQGRVNPDFSAGYSGLLGGDTLAAEVSGNLVFSTSATTASVAGNYLVSASGQASNNYALNYVEGVLKVKPTEALQSAVASVIAAVAVAPSQGNMVQADMIVSGETAPGKPAATQEAPREGEKGNAGSAPVVQLASNVVSNVLPGLRLSVVDSGLRLPIEAGGNKRQENQ